MKRGEVPAIDMAPGSATAHLPAAGVITFYQKVSSKR
jgi:hypothetical protein